MQETFIIGLSMRQVAVKGPGLSVPRSQAVASGSGEITFGLGRRTDMTILLFLTLGPWLGGSEPGCATGSWDGLLAGENWWAGSRRWPVEMPSGHG